MTAWEQRQYNLAHKRRSILYEFHTLPGQHCVAYSKLQKQGYTPIKKNDVPLEKYLELAAKNILGEWK